MIVVLHIPHQQVPFCAYYRNKQEVIDRALTNEQASEYLASEGLLDRDCSDDGVNYTDALEALTFDNYSARVYTSKEDLLDSAPLPTHQQHASTHLYDILLRLTSAWWASHNEISP